MKFDELNQLKRYYSVMEIPQKEKDKRVSLAMFFYDIFLYVLVMIRTELKIDETKASKEGKPVEKKIDKDFYIKSLNGRIRDILEENNLPYDENYIPQLTKDVIDATERHLDEEYYFSKERALLIAQNEANTVYNSVDFNKAKAEGKKYKRWVTSKDERVRPAHILVDEEKIPINEMFKVGGDEMRFPHDYENGSPENLINCRCTCVYE